MSPAFSSASRIHQAPSLKPKATSDPSRNLTGSTVSISLKIDQGKKKKGKSGTELLSGTYLKTQSFTESMYVETRSLRFRSNTMALSEPLRVQCLITVPVIATHKPQHIKTGFPCNALM